jgi:hypothetical protein
MPSNIGRQRPVWVLSNMTHTRRILICYFDKALSRSGRLPWQSCKPTFERPFYTLTVKSSSKKPPADFRMLLRLVEKVLHEVAAV